MKHQVKNLFIESYFPEKEQAMDFQQNAASFLEENWQEKLAVWMDKLCPEDQCIKIDRLDIEVILKGTTFDLNHWSELVLKALKEKLTDKLAAFQMNKNDQVTAISTAASWLEQVIFFWRTGNMPWNSDSATFDFPLSKAVIDENELAIASAKSDLRRLLAEREFFIRCFTTLEFDAFFSFVRIIVPGKFAIPEMLEAVGRLFADLFDVNTKRNVGGFMAQLWKEFFRLDSPAQTTHVSLSEILHFIYRYTRYGINKGTEWKDAFSHASYHAFLVHVLETNESWPKHLKEEVKGLIREFELNKEKGAVEFSRSEDLDEVHGPGAKFAEPGLKSINKHEKAEWLADDAGVVLLHPFIEMLFTELEAYDIGDKQLKAPDLAVRTMHYLVYGTIKFQPHRLATIRCLCGLDERCVLQEVDLPASVKSECDQLLNSVIKHWKILKKTSAEGLRVSFLQRKGLLYEKPEHFELKVEKQSYDILLDHLPWSYGIIKLPWMTMPMYVKWHNTI